MYFLSEIPDDDRGVQRQSSENHVNGCDVCRARVCARFNLLPACEKGRRSGGYDQEDGTRVTERERDAGRETELGGKPSVGSAMETDRTNIYIRKKGKECAG